MESIRKWLYKPKKDDKSLLAQFFYADEDLNIVANELDSFDGRKDPVRCTILVSQLRQAQDKVLTITNSIMDVLIGNERADRDFRVKFPEDVLQENLAGQLWFGAECLAAGSSIMNRESESTAMRPLAKAVTKSLENVRNLLRDACLRNNTPNGPIKLDSNELVTEMLLESLKIFDRLFAEFELAYVSAMVPVKTTLEYELQELIGVLFSETLQRALKMKLLTQELVDDCDPALMFTIPRLAIVSGLLMFPNGPLFIDRPMEEMSEMFRPFRTLLHKIRELLWVLNKRELYMLEKLLCDNEQISDVKLTFIFAKTLFQIFHRQVPTMFKNATKQAKEKKSPHRISANIIDIPSTSGHSIPSTVFHNTIITANSISPSQRIRHDSPPDHDSLEINLEDSESPIDSGICTETTSLDRSPSFDADEPKNCGCINRPSPTFCSCNPKKTAKKRPNLPIQNIVRAQAHFMPGTSNSLSKLSVRLRKKRTNERIEGGTVDEDSPSTDSSETSSFHSNCADDEEIALAMQAAEVASRNEVRSKYRSSEDLLHRLFVCIAGVADQLQTNFACDLRNILKSVFLINASSSEPAKSLELPGLDVSIEYHPPEGDVIENSEFSVDPNILAQEALFDTNVYFHLDAENCPTEYSNHPRQHQSDENSLSSLSSDLNRPPVWIPDVEAPKCMSCGVNFTVVKRRHHCRNCGKVFCARCSSNSVPLPKFGHVKPVRVCNKCFIYNLTPFTM
ncbi:hypothetical protein JTB14_012291 [Gonioctena quinquepunctata]|nr:hypothetical protein JTB14_012291 [Gonioctena quinquepunctata]